MEQTIAANKGKDAITTKVTPYKAKYEAKRPREASKIEKKDAHAITSKSTKFSFKTKRREGGLTIGDNKRLTLKEMQAKEYSFFESDIPGMFEELLKAKLIELAEPKHPEEANKGTEPDYYYDPTKDAPMGKSTPEVKTHGLNETQEKLQHKGYSIKSPTAGLGCTLKPPLRIMIKRLANYHITEANQEPFLNPEETTRIIVFQRLGNSNNHEKEPAEISLPEVGDKYQESNPTHVHLPKTRRNQEQRA
ncbi:hypothetical protein LIER_37806 [Lithospermum erythrorhizon]|uniref:Uncharacterized protein n=1 Tax=Lithospermum erythrorhizon TaxID=34254 RepID=A0AAV3PQT0_LITER